MKVGIIMDVASVITDAEAEVICKQGDIFVSHEFRGNKVVTRFTGDGVMYIYPNPKDVVENLEGGVLYDTHTNPGNPSEGYRNELKRIFGNK